MNTEHDILHEKKPSNSWIIIFADLLALMLTFFVLMFSMNSVQVSEWKSVVVALSEHLNPERSFVSEKEWKKYDTSLVYQQPALSLDYLYSVLEEKLKYNGLLQRATLKNEGEYLTVSLPADLVFEDGTTVLSDEAYDALRELGESLRFLRNEISVGGHSGPSLPKDDRYSSNWELSLVRAIIVADILKKSGYPSEIEAYGYGASRFGELDSDIPLYKRYLLGRRVDIIVWDNQRSGTAVLAPVL